MIEFKIIALGINPRKGGNPAKDKNSIKIILASWGEREIRLKELESVPICIKFNNIINAERVRE